jgi:hypothetical protein
MIDEMGGDIAGFDQLNERVPAQMFFPPEMDQQWLSIALHPDHITQGHRKGTDAFAIANALRVTPEQVDACFQAPGVLLENLLVDEDILLRQRFYIHLSSPLPILRLFDTKCETHHHLFQMFHGRFLSQTPLRIVLLKGLSRCSSLRT